MRLGLMLALLCLAATSAVHDPGATSLDGLWTTVPYAQTPLHDAIRIEHGSVTCEHGGYRKLKPVACPKWDRIMISLRGSTVSLKIGDDTSSGQLSLNSSQCSWTDAAPGQYWAGPSKANHYIPPYTPSCDVIAFGSAELTTSVWIRLKEVTEVHIVSMSHLDVGYTGSMSFTLNSYLTDFFPRALAVQKELDAAGHADKLHYVTHSWLVHMFMRCDEWTALVGARLDAPLRCPNATLKADFVAAVKRGTITWHAGPMNMQVVSTRARAHARTCARTG